MSNAIGFDPVITQGGGGGGGVTSVAAVGSTPAAAGASIAGAVLTLQPADGTHPGVIAASGAQTLGAALTLAQTATFSNGLNTSGAIGINGGNVISINATGTFLTLANGPYGAYSILFEAGQTAMTFTTTPSSRSVVFPHNTGFSFATTLAPSGTTQTVDWTTGSSQKIDAASTTGTLVLTFSNPVDGGRYILKTLGKSGRAWTFPSSVKWAGGVAPTVTATDGAKDMFELYYDAGDSTYIGRIIAQNVS